MITTVTLSRGAMRMAERRVVVKRLASIHHLCAMTVLCSDKTGTLTSAKITLARSLGASGNVDQRCSSPGVIPLTRGGDPGALDAALIGLIMQKTGAWSLPALVRLAVAADRLGGAQAAPRSAQS